MSAAPDPTPERDRLLQLLGGFAPAQAVAVAAELKVADGLAGEPRSAPDLAAELGADPGALARLLRTLASLGVLTQYDPAGPDPHGAVRYGLSPAGEPLRSGVPGSVRELAVLACGDAAWRAWGALGHSVRTGETAFRHLFGTGPFSYYASKPELAANFNAAMADNTRILAPLIAAGHDFSQYGTLTDVGGGNGTLLAAVLTAYPRLRGTLFDTAAGSAAAAANLAPVADRATVIVGDFFDSVPAGSQAYLLKSIIHDWTDAESERILRAVRAAAGPTGTLLLAEPVLPERASAEAAGADLSDLNMLVNTGGRERTRADFARLMAAAGFRLDQVSAPIGPGTAGTTMWTIPHHVLVGTAT